MTTTEAPATARRAIADMRAGLDQLDAWVASHPDIRVGGAAGAGYATFTVYSEDAPTVVRAMTDGAPLGSIEKAPGLGGELFFVRRTFAGGVILSFHTRREEVCTRRVVGTETVQVPDPLAPLVDVEREIVEWDCLPILAGGA